MTPVNPILEGEELLVHALSSLLGKPSSYRHEVGADAPLRLVGGTIQIEEDGRMITGDGREFRLPRIVKRMPALPFPTEEVDYVYLRDVVEALGGTYEFDAELMEVSVTIPDPPEASQPGKPISNIDPALSPTSASKDTPSSELIILAVGFSIALIAGAGVPKR